MNAHPSLKTNANPGLSVGAIVAQNLLIARMAVGWAQQRLANASGVSRATIAQLEAGVGDPRLSTLELLAAALHVTPSLLMLDEAGFRAIRDVENFHPPESPRRRSTGFVDNVLIAHGYEGRLRVAQMGVDAATEAGLKSTAHLVGAAIGSVRLASGGTFLGAHLAHLMDTHKSPAIGGNGNAEAEVQRAEFTENI